MIVAVLIDATDGTFARKFRVKDVVPHIDGRKLDDIVDYLNYTFLPLLMVGSADWLPSPTWLWASVPLVASVFAFVHTGAKEETNGFFLGFPSYWNVFAFYTAVWLSGFGQGIVLAIALVLSGLSVLPLRFVYPNRAPRWRALFVGGARLAGDHRRDAVVLPATPGARCPALDLGRLSGALRRCVALPRPAAPQRFLTSDQDEQRLLGRARLPPSALANSG